MELSWCVGLRLEFFWLGTLFSLASALNVCSTSLFFMSINGALFMCLLGKAFFLRGFRWIWHYTQVRAPQIFKIFFSFFFSFAPQTHTHLHVEEDEVQQPRSL